REIDRVPVEVVAQEVSAGAWIGARAVAGGVGDEVVKGIGDDVGSPVERVERRSLRSAAIANRQPAFGGGDACAIAAGGGQPEENSDAGPLPSVHRRNLGD